jgi:Na+/melibiose symporter-like transporter
MKFSDRLSLIGISAMMMGLCAGLVSSLMALVIAGIFRPDEQPILLFGLIFSVAGIVFGLLYWNTSIKLAKQIYQNGYKEQQ